MNAKRHRTMHARRGRDGNGNGNGAVRLEPTARGSSFIDVLDHVLNKGIVIDAWVRLSLVGLSLATIEARVVVASIETYLHHAEIIGQRPLWPRVH